MITPRQYQVDAKNAACEFFASSKKKAEVQILPTGTGKSIIPAMIAQELKGNVLLFQPSKELVEQNLAKMRAFGIDAKVFSASMGKKDIGEVTLATIGSVKNASHLFSATQYIMVDECHLVNAKGGMYKNFFSEIGTKILGLTATPFRLHSGLQGSQIKFLTRTFPRIFEDVNYVMQTGDAYFGGYWSKMEYFPYSGFDRTQIARNSNGSEFDSGSVRRYYDKINFIENVVDVVSRIQRKNRRGIMVFCQFLEDCRLIKSECQNSEIVSGDMAKQDRERVIKAFKYGEISTILNVGVLTTGFDYPELDSIIIARPTMSLSLWYQMVGRGVRPHPDKQSTWIVDMCDNYRIFGRPEDYIIAQSDKGKWALSRNGFQLTNRIL